MQFYNLTKNTGYPQFGMKDQEYDYFYNDQQDIKYCYPGTNVLKNKLDIRDLDFLHDAERDYSSIRHRKCQTP